MRHVFRLKDHLRREMLISNSFGIDKLCLPYENMARQLALLNAPRIMKKADKVLVLDPTLYLVDIAGSTECLARIQNSTWDEQILDCKRRRLGKQSDLPVSKQAHRTSQPRRGF